MGKPIIKADREHDLYVEWSSVVDSPTFVGTRAEMLEYLLGPKVLRQHEPPNLGRRRDDPEARLRRADELGSSSIRDPLTTYDGPLDGAWEDTGFMVQQTGWLPRSRLYDWLMAGMPDEMLDPFEDEV